MKPGLTEFRIVLSCALLGVSALFATNERSLSAAEQPGSPPAGDPAALAAEHEFFEKKIRPLLHRHCFECHDAANGPKNGELVLDSAAGIRKGGSRGPLSVAGKPEDSLLLRAVRYTDPELEMPPAGKLAAEEIGLLTEWVRRGAHVPKDRAAAAPTVSKEPGNVRDYWAFRPLQTSPPRSPGNSSWPLTRIDAYLLDRMNDVGLKPSPEADRRSLIRRVTFDLTGLPPTADEVLQFSQDDRPDAYERLVERLLHSPRFGERTARAWLDLVRYTDTVASWLKGTENAWLYRDWVVQSFNADRPYDDFIRRQLAADLMEDSLPADWAALGLLGLSPTYWKELRLAPNVIQTVVCDEWDERIDCVSRTFLGLTVSCARCHPHKFDPISMEDYYGLAGVFASCQLADRPLLPEPRAQAVREARQKRSQWETQLKKVTDQNSHEANALREQLAKLRAETPEIDEPWAHVVEEAALYVLPDGTEKTRLDVRRGESRDVPLLRRGSPSNPGDVVPRRFLAALSSGEPRSLRTGSGRGELAEAIVTDARPLTARIIVNRVWAGHFGRGIVATVSDFGTQGERPTHPELLDDLAARFIEHGWSLKWLHREIVTSAAYRQRSGEAMDSNAMRSAGVADPENRWLGRMPRRRLDVEGWRDSLLVASGLLDARIGGPPQSLDEPANQRRTLYGTVGRHEQSDLHRLYDFPEPATHSPNRVPTTTPLQQLFALNSPFMDRVSHAMAARLLATPGLTDRERIASAYRDLLQRDPTTEELALGERFLESSATDDSRRLEAWQLYAQALLNLNEVMYLD